MKAVGLRELKNRLSEYVREVRAGETVLVTDRGVVVAELVPPSRGAADWDVPPGLAELARKGLARLGRRNDPSAYPTLRRLAPDGTAQRWLNEVRGER